MKIREIAEEAGVSTTTVSRVFSHHPNIRKELRDRVIAVAKKYAYHPKLSTKQRNIVILTQSKSFYPIQTYVEMVLTELTAELSSRGYRIEILPVGNIGRLDRIQFCGAVSIGAEESLFPNWDENFAVPLILIDRPVTSKACNLFSVHSDEKQAMALAVGYLAENGCKKIGCVVYGEPGIGNIDARVKWTLQALEKRGLPSHARLVRTSFSEGYVEEIGKLLRLGVDGLFCPGGNAGIIASYALSLYGKRVPEDICLIASERTIFSRYTIPPQTTISQDYAAQAKAAADIFDQHFYKQHSIPVNTVIPYRLIERDSVMRR